MDEAGWRALFGFEEPYANQADAIEAAIAAGREGGFLAMEGPCGTGKTMAALTAAAHLIREGGYDRALVVTPVKQQRRQFVEDLRAMNAGLEEPLSGVALVGKDDLCPYEREGAFPEDVGVHARCEDLRESTAALVEGPGGGDGEQWWDPELALELVRSARQDADTYQTLDSALATAGAESPYPRHQPTAPERLAAGSDPPLFCPFEADWYARDRGSPVGFASGEEHVITAEEYLPGAVERGTCPHRAMGVLLEEAEVVIGNYNHLFDPQTRGLTDAILDSGTFVIVDEAHRLEERVRDLLSDALGRHTLRRAREDCALLVRASRERRENRDRIETELSAYDVPLGAIERLTDFLDDLIAWLEERATAFLEEEYGPRPTADRPEEVEVPLRDPEGTERDELTEWALESYDGDFWESLGAIGAAVEGVLDAVEPERSPVCGAVGTLLERWWERDHAAYFREIVMERSPDPAEEWMDAYAPRFVLFNCMPAEELAAVLGALGGGVLMSATLEPLDVFREVSGLDELADAGRPVTERTYELPFPEENRASWIVDAGRFTARERGEPDVGNRNETRERFARVLRDVATSRGNAMLCLPSYREAAWAAARLEGEIEKPVLCDEPSSAEATEELKREFFRGEAKVLVTSTRGTLTEGVDYAGEKLSTCAVVGVPLVNVGSPRIRAVRQAYGDAFGAEVAFEYALTVPAVRRARQAIGRVIRGPGERGVRILVDERYSADAAYHSVHGYLPEGERAEFTRMTPMFLASQFESFWG